MSAKVGDAWLMAKAVAAEPPKPPPYSSVLGAAPCVWILENIDKLHTRFDARGKFSDFCHVQYDLELAREQEYREDAQRDDEPEDEDDIPW
jgi:hypothetical protein